MTDPRPVSSPPRGAPGAHRPRHLHVIERPDAKMARRRAAVRVLVAAGFAVTVAVVFALVLLHVVAAQNQLRLDKLSGQATQEQVTYERLRLQVAQLESPEHIISTAVGKLGMRQPTSVTYLTPTGPAAAALAGQPTANRGRSVGSQPVTGDADWPAIKSKLAGSP